MSHEKEPLREVPDAKVTGWCIDCGVFFKGTLGARFIETAEGPGIEICVCAAGRAHALARIERDLLPTVICTREAEE